MKFDKNEMIKYFSDNKNGQKTRECNIVKRFPNLIGEIAQYNLTFNLNSINLIQKLYNYLYDIIEIPKCETCKNETTFRGIFTEGYLKTCSKKCRGNSLLRLERIKNTTLMKYGVDSVSKVETIKKKRKETFFKKFGNENIFQSEVIKNKTDKTNLLKYGNLRPMKSNILKEQIKESNTKKYGVDHPFKLDSFKEKLRSFHMIKLKERIKNYGYDFIQELEHDKFQLKHPDGHLFEIDRGIILTRMKYKMDLSTVFNPIDSNISSYERELKRFLDDLNVNTIINSKKIIDSYLQLDVYIPEKQIAIEMNGIYWHSELFISKDYHLIKTEKCKKIDIQLIHIFEDEWIYKRPIVESIIKSKLGMFENKIYARKCTIKNIKTVDAELFLNNNHIQGNIGSKYKYGLYYNGELVSMMNFGYYRKSMGKNKVENQFELLRFCNKLNTSVIGGASKLFAHFINEVNPDKVVSYADRRYSNGNLYENLKFNFLKNTSPNYFYVNKSLVIREQRFKYRKDILIKQGFDVNKTEHQIMIERKFLRIYDCGNMKFEWIKKEPQFEALSID